MKRRYFLVALMAALVFSAVPVLAGGTMWVTSEKARLKSKPKASSTTLATVSVGAKVSVLESKKRWYKVRTSSGEKGWMYRGKLSDTPPAKETEDSDNLFSSMQASSISADEAQTSRSIRGLSKETERYAQQRRTPEVYKKALDQVLAIRITDKEVDVFLKTGKIGEYAP
jgi:uncharacterized protein YgiM (DUF1202 family)